MRELAEVSAQLARNREKLKQAEAQRDQYRGFADVYQSIQRGEGKYLLFMPGSVWTREQMVDHVKEELRAPNVRKECVDKVLKDPTWKKKLDATADEREYGEILDQAVTEELGWYGSRRLAFCYERHEKCLPTVVKDLHLALKGIEELDEDIRYLAECVRTMEDKLYHLLGEYGLVPPDVLSVLWADLLDGRAQQGARNVYRGGMSKESWDLFRTTFHASLATALLFRKVNSQSFECRDVTVTMSVLPDGGVADIPAVVVIRGSLDAQVEREGQVRVEGELQYRFSPARRQENGTYLGKVRLVTVVTRNGKPTEGSPNVRDQRWLAVPWPEGDGFDIVMDKEDAAPAEMLRRARSGGAFYRLQKIESQDD